MQDQVLAKYKCDSLQFRAMHTSPVAPANKHRSRNHINVLASPRFPQCRWFIMSGQLTLMLLSGGKYLLLFVSSLRLYRIPSIRQSGSHCSTQDLAHQRESIHTLTHDSQYRPDVLILVVGYFVICSFSQLNVGQHPLIHLFYCSYLCSFVHHHCLSVDNSDRLTAKLHILTSSWSFFWLPSFTRSLLL